MVTVGDSVVGVEAALVAGRVGCPLCGAALAGWGWAGTRSVRGRSGVATVRPRRGRCVGCGVTQVLLPAGLLARRADAAEVIGAALAAAASGSGWRTVAARLGRPGETVRGWLRVFRARAEAVRLFFTTLMVAVGVDPVVPAAAGTALADAVASVFGAVVAAGSRWPGVVGLSPWRIASVVSGGLLLAPGWPPETINTSRP